MRYIGMGFEKRCDIRKEYIVIREVHALYKGNYKMIICKLINKVLYVVSIFFIICCVISLLGNDLFFDKLNNVDYKKTYKYEYPFSGIDNICVDDEFVYCFNQYFQAVNVYDKRGNYAFTIKVPKRQNGSGYMYMKNDKLWIKIILMTCMCIEKENL